MGRSNNNNSMEKKKAEDKGMMGGEKLLSGFIGALWIPLIFKVMVPYWPSIRNKEDLMFLIIAILGAQALVLIAGYSAKEWNPRKLKWWCFACWLFYPWLTVYYIKVFADKYL